MATKAIVGEKVGMTQVWDEQNRAVPVTVVKVAPCRVVQVKTPEHDGYSALQVTFGVDAAEAPDQARGGPLRQGRRRAGPAPGRAAARRRERLRGRPGDQGRPADAGRSVDVTAVSKGKGFAGVMKRHNFSGQGAGHGAHKCTARPAPSARAPRPSRVFKGTRWPAAWATSG